MTARNAQHTRYGGGETEDYSSDLDTYSNNISECGSDNSDYGSGYESDIETNTIETIVFNNFDGHSPANGAYLSLQITNACLSSVLRYECRQSVVRYNQCLRCESVLFKLFVHQMMSTDM